MTPRLAYGVSRQAENGGGAPRPTVASAATPPTPDAVEARARPVFEVRDGRAWLIIHMTKGRKVPCTGYGCRHSFHDPSLAAAADRLRRGELP